MSLFDAATCVLLIVLGLKLVINVGMVGEYFSAVTEKRGRGLTLMVFEPLPLALAAILVSWQFESVADGAFVFGVGCVAILASYVVGWVLGKGVRWWRQRQG